MLNVLHVMSGVPLLFRLRRYPEHALLDFFSVEIGLRVKASWEEKERRQEIAEDCTHLVFFQPGAG